MNILIKRSTEQGLDGSWAQLVPCAVGGVPTSGTWKHSPTQKLPFMIFNEKNPLGIETCFLNLIRDPDSRANTILNVENVSFEISKRLNIVSIQCYT